MCVPAFRIIIYYMISLLLVAYSPISCHIPSYMSTPSNKVEQYCELSDACVHDTIPVCGRMGDDKRTFLDLCDLLEFACDTNQIFTHVDDIEGCPVMKKPK